MLHTDDIVEPRCELLIFTAARAQLVSRVIKPALDNGDIVLCDRYIDSSVAYQGFSRGLGAEKIRDLSLWATGNLIPDFTIYLDVPAEAGEQRMDGTDRMEIQSRDFHEAVHQAFRDIAAASPYPNVVIDATAPKDDVAAAVRIAIDGVLASR